MLKTRGDRSQLLLSLKRSVDGDDWLQSGLPGEVLCVSGHDRARDRDLFSPRYAISYDVAISCHHLTRLQRPRRFGLQVSGEHRTMSDRDPIHGQVSITEQVTSMMVIPEVLSALSYQVARPARILACVYRSQRCRPNLHTCRDATMTRHRLKKGLLRQLSG